MGESTKKISIGWRSTNDLQWWKKNESSKTTKTKKEEQCEQEKTGEQPIREEGITNQKQTLYNNTPEERTRNKTYQGNLNWKCNNVRKK